jgi:hypothetical protein
MCMCTHVKCQIYIDFCVSLTQKLYFALAIVRWRVQKCFVCNTHVYTTYTLCE